MAVSVFRNGINLTKLSDNNLKKIIARLRNDGKVADQADFVKTFAQNFGARKLVHEAALTIDAWETVNTETTHTEPSPESFAWSNLEGGHTFHKVPSFKLEASELN